MDATERTGIGGSDLDDCLNVPPYGCARRLGYERRKTPADYPETNTLLLERGQALEPLVVARYLHGRPGLKAVRRAPINHPEHPWAKASVDRELLGDTRGVGILECKSHATWIFRKMRTEGLPASHIVQLDWYLWIRQRPWGVFAVLCPDTWELLTFEVPRDDSLVEAIFPHVERMWRMIENGPLPDPLDPKDRRCQRCPWRKTCHGGALFESAASHAELAIEPVRDESLASVLADLAEAKEMALEATALEEAIKERLRQQMGDRIAVAAEGYRVYYKEQVQTRVDTAALRSKYPAIAKEVERSIKMRPLRVYAT